MTTNSPRKNEQKWCSVVDVSGDESKIWCKEQYCIGTWNARSTNRGKLDTVKQETVRRNINILGTSELRWTGMGEFNSDDHYIYYCGQESHRRNGIVLRVNKRVWNVVCGCNLKNDRMISLRFQGQPFNITVIQAYAPTMHVKEAEVDQFYEDLEHLLEITPKQMFYSSLGTGTQKAGSQEIPGVSRQVWPWKTKWSRVKGNWILPRECTGHSKHPFSTTQEMTLHMDSTKGSIPKSNWWHSL